MSKETEIELSANDQALLGLGLDEAVSLESPKIEGTFLCEIAGDVKAVETEKGMIKNVVVLNILSNADGTPTQLRGETIFDNAFIAVKDVKAYQARRAEEGKEPSVLKGNQPKWVFGPRRRMVELRTSIGLSNELIFKAGETKGRRVVARVKMGKAFGAQEARPEVESYSPVKDV